jgi:hypothetical protein
MYGCTEASIDQALTGKEPRDIAMYAMSVLSDAQEQLREVPVSDRATDTARMLMNVAKYAIDKAVPR